MSAPPFPSFLPIKRPAAKLHIRCAASFRERALGLLGTSHLARDEGLLIRPCGAIHTFGMRYAIDVVFLDRRGCILAVRAELPPWRFALCRQARAVLELAAGSAARVGLSRGQTLDELRPWL